MIDAQWQQTPELRPGVTLDEYVIMPNHLHLLIALEGVEIRPDNSSNILQPRSISTIIRGFKAAVTSKVQPDNPIWQRNYYEHIVRSEQQLNAIRDYIRLNPARWAEDKENPANQI